MENIKNEKGNVIEMTENINGKIQNMDDYEDIGLDEVVEKCSEFLKGEIKEEEFKEWLNNIFVLYYLPLQTKYDIVMDMLYDTEIFVGISEYPPEIKTEIGKWFFIMFAYTNINVDDYYELITMENYDITIRCLGKMFNNICGEDYRRTIEMYENIMSINNLKGIIQMISNMSTKGDEEIEKDLANTFKELKNNEDLIREFAKIIDFNNLKVKM